MSNNAFVDTKYKWVMFTFIFCMGFSANYSQFQVSAFAVDVMQEFSMNTTQLASVVTGQGLAAGAMGLIAGLLMDKFGSKRVIAICSFVAAGCAMLRASAGSYAMLLALSLPAGIMMGVALAGLGKIVAAWFPQRQHGMAFGAYTAGNGLGTASAQAFSGMYGSYKSALLGAGILLLAVAVFWTAFAKNRPAGSVAPPPGESMFKNLGLMVKRKNVWFASMGSTCFIVVLMVTSSFTPVALATVRGLDRGTAGFYSSFLNIGIVLGSIPISTFAQRIGKVRTTLLVSTLIGSILSFVTWFIPTGAMYAVARLLAGFFVGPGNPLFMATIPRLSEVGQKYAGTANGIMAASNQFFGTFIIPTLVIAPLAGTNYTLTCAMAMAFGLIMPLMAWLLPDISAGKTAKE